MTHTEQYKLVPVTDSRNKRIPNLFKRNGTYYLQATINGTRYLRSVPHDTQTEARSWVKAFIRTAKEARSDGLQALEDSKAKTAYPTLGRLFDLYIDASAKRRATEDGRPLESTVKRNIAQLRNVVSQATGLENGKVAEFSTEKLTDDLVDVYVQKVVEEAGDNHLLQQKYRNTAASTLRQAKSVFAKWVVHYYSKAGVKLPPGIDSFLTHGPVIRRKKYQLPPKALINTTLAEAQKLKETRPDLYLIFLLCYHTGLRAGEAAAARWEWLEDVGVDGNTHRCISIKAREYWKGAKNHVSHKPPLTDAIWDEFQALKPAEAGDLDFILPPDTPTGRANLIGRTFSSWLNSIGWSDYGKSAHELRKLAGSIWYTKVDLKWAASWLGDNLQTVYDYYADLTEQHAPVDLSKLD